MRRRVRAVSLLHLNPSGRWPSGNERLYFRPKGEKGVALPDLPRDDPRFIAAWSAAWEAWSGKPASPRRPAVAGSIAAEVALYKASDAWNLLRATTRAKRRPTLDQIAEAYGHGRIRDLGPEHVGKDLDKFAGHARNNRLKVWRGFGTWLADAKRLKDRHGLPFDPTVTLGKARVAKSDGHVPWSLEDVEKFRERWPLDTVARLAFELIFWTGARVGDAIRLGEGHEDREGWLAYKQAKTGGDVAVPYTRALPEFAEGFAPDLALLCQAVATRTVRHMTFLHTEKGASRSPKAVSQWFAARARAAGLDARTAHGLRKARAIALVEAGATTHQVSAWTGHESLREIERYTRGFNKRKALTRTKPDPEVPTSRVQFQEAREKEA